MIIKGLQPSTLSLLHTKNPFNNRMLITTILVLGYLCLQLYLCWDILKALKHWKRALLNMPDYFNRDQLYTYLQDHYMYFGFCKTILQNTGSHWHCLRIVRAVHGTNMLPVKEADSLYYLGEDKEAILEAVEKRIRLMRKTVIVSFFPFVSHYRKVFKPIFT